MTIAIRPEILSSLNTVREDVQRQVAGLDRYRALKAIEQTIADFAMLEEIARPMSDIRDEVLRQLDETRQYRALRAIERIMPELSEAFDLLDLHAESEGRADLRNAEPEGPASGEPTVEAGAAATLGQPASDPIVAAGENDTIGFVESERDAEVAAVPADSEGSPARPQRSAPETLGDPHVPDPIPASAVVPSLADTVAQLMAQPAAPSSRDAHSVGGPQERGGVDEVGSGSATHAERAA